MQPIIGSDAALQVFSHGAGAEDHQIVFRREVADHDPDEPCEVLQATGLAALRWLAGVVVMGVVVAGMGQVAMVRWHVRLDTRDRR